MIRGLTPDRRGIVDSDEIGGGALSPEEKFYSFISVRRMIVGQGFC